MREDLPHAPGEANSRWGARLRPECRENAQLAGILVDIGRRAERCAATDRSPGTRFSAGIAARAGRRTNETEEMTMPETFGKRQRKDVKAKKAAAAEERRLARVQRRRDREAGLIEPGPPVATPEEIESQLGIVPPGLAD
jgi:hypothetical protein